MSAFPDRAGTAAGEPPWVRTHLQTPREDGGLLAVPELNALGRLARANASSLARPSSGDVETHIPLAPTPSERAEARDEAARAAVEYTGRLLEAVGSRLPVNETKSESASVPRDAQTGLWFVTGHQPALFHPGVWIKNRVVGRLAQKFSGVSLNLIVDNDTTSAPSVLVPGGSPRSPAFDSIAYDESQPARPWEEAQIRDHSVFEQFGLRAQGALANFGIEPLAVPFWKDVVAAERVLRGPGAAFTAARAALERRLGWGNLELPLSRVCELPSFRRFVGRLLAQLPRFHVVYNGTLSEYRKVNRVRSRTHPVPDLRRESDWLEAPFWVWEHGDVQRRRLRVRETAGALELHDGLKLLGQIPRTAGDPGEPACAVLAKLSRQGVRLRTRALSTTLFSRLHLADLFVHGIGGAKYDEMTDRIFTRFYGVVPPTFGVLSATVRLPIASSIEPAPGVNELKNRLRELEFHAERHLDVNDRDSFAPLVAEKLRLIEEQRAAREGRLPLGASEWYAAAPGSDRYRRLRQVNRELARSTAHLRERLRLQLVTAIERQSSARVRSHREYAFCLFPLVTLRDFFENVCNSVG